MCPRQLINKLQDGENTVFLICLFLISTGDEFQVWSEHWKAELRVWSRRFVFNYGYLFFFARCLLLIELALPIFFLLQLIFRVRFFEFCHRLKEKVFVHFWTFIHPAAKWSISTCFHPLKWACPMTTAPRGCAAVSQVFSCNSVEWLSCVINPDPASLAVSRPLPVAPVKPVRTLSKQTRRKTLA